MEFSSKTKSSNDFGAGNAQGEAAIAATRKIDNNANMLDLEINVLTRHSSSLLTELISNMLLPAKLSCVCYLAMMYLHGCAEHCANPSEISRAIGDTRTNMTRICDELVLKGLVQRLTNATDRRRVDLSLTTQGVALLHEVVPLVRGRLKAVMSEFSLDEKALLIRLMARLNKSLEAHL